MKNKIITTSLTLSIGLLSACNGVTNWATLTDIVPTTNQSDNKIIRINKTISLTSIDKNGAVNPIVPENLASIQVGGIFIPAKDIKITSDGFTAKAINSTVKVAYNGSNQKTLDTKDITIGSDAKWVKNN